MGQDLEEKTKTTTETDSEPRQVTESKMLFD